MASNRLEEAVKTLRGKGSSRRKSRAEGPKGNLARRASPHKIRLVDHEIQTGPLHVIGRHEDPSRGSSCSIGDHFIDNGGGVQIVARRAFGARHNWLLEKEV